jgi:NAD(P)-dependent dehydrogenase (short-subunit alcohol dehydrogenase family)
MPPFLSSTTAIVTGGTSGIGQATVLALVAAGARVAFVGRSAKRLAETTELATQIAERDRLLPLQLDVRSPEQMQVMVDQTVQTFETIDVLVAAAGVGGGGSDHLPKMVMQLSTDEWDAVINTNLRGVFLANRAVLPVMIRQRRGEVLNVSSSRGARLGLPFAAAYAASKHAMIGLTEALAEEVAGYGIRVQAILPDVTDTPLMVGADHLCPEGMLAPCQVADMIVQMVTNPEDELWHQPLLAPRRQLRSA